MQAEIPVPLSLSHFQEKRGNRPGRSTVHPGMSNEKGACTAVVQAP